MFCSTGRTAVTGEDVVPKPPIEGAEEWRIGKSSKECRASSWGKIRLELLHARLSDEDRRRRLQLAKELPRHVCSLCIFQTFQIRHVGRVTSGHGHGGAGGAQFPQRRGPRSSSTFPRATTTRSATADGYLRPKTARRGRNFVPIS